MQALSAIAINIISLISKHLLLSLPVFLVSSAFVARFLVKICFQARSFLAKSKILTSTIAIFGVFGLCLGIFVDLDAAIEKIFGKQKFVGQIHLLVGPRQPSGGRPAGPGELVGTLRTTVRNEGDPIQAPGEVALFGRFTQGVRTLIFARNVGNLDAFTLDDVFPISVSSNISEFPNYLSLCMKNSRTNSFAVQHYINTAESNSMARIGEGFRAVMVGYMQWYPIRHAPPSVSVDENFCRNAMHNRDSHPQDFRFELLRSIAEWSASAFRNIRITNITATFSPAWADNRLSSYNIVIQFNNDIPEILDGSLINYRFRDGRVRSSGGRLSALSRSSSFNILGAADQNRIQIQIIGPNGFGYHPMEYPFDFRAVALLYFKNRQADWNEMGLFCRGEVRRVCDVQHLRLLYPAIRTIYIGPNENTLRPALQINIPSEELNNFNFFERADNHGLRPIELEEDSPDRYFQIEFFDGSRTRVKQIGFGRY